jgi:hypothetical protein
LAEENRTLNEGERSSWEDYFRQHLVGTFRTRVDGRRIQFGTLVSQKQISTFESMYAAAIEASVIIFVTKVGSEVTKPHFVFCTGASVKPNAITV